MEEEQPGQSMANLPIITSTAQTPFGALRDVWRTVLYHAASGDPVTVLLFPDVGWLSKYERMLALDKHFKACRNGCSLLGQRVRLQSLHPDTQPESQEESQIEAERRRAPLPAFTLSSRIGPSVLRPPGAASGEATDASEEVAVEDPSVREARESLERQFRKSIESGAASAEPVGAPSKAATTGAGGAVTATSEPRAVLDETMVWFAVYFERVHRLFGGRQRRVVVSAPSAEVLFAAIWSEAARLYGDDVDVEEALSSEGAGGSDAPVVLQEPEEALSSLLVITGELAEVDAYRSVRQSLALSFALLGLEPLFTLSAFHPKDTFEILTAPDGTRSWETTLPHPLIHLVKRMKTASMSS